MLAEDGWFWLSIVLGSLLLIIVGGGGWLIYREMRRGPSPPREPQQTPSPPRTPEVTNKTTSVKVGTHDQRVRLDFEETVDGILFSPVEARRIAGMILREADAIEGQEATRSATRLTAWQRLDKE